MINIEDLQEVTHALHNYQPVKKIKVTKEFAIALMKSAKFEEKPSEFYSGGGITCRFDSVLIEIDDEIDGLYEFVY
jgi:hypothetical protein